MTNKYTCIIIDDELQAIGLLSDMISSFYEGLQLIRTYSIWSKALEGLRDEQPDILFLDISMQGRNGLDLLRYIPDLKSEVIVTTAYSDHALEAFKLNAGGYLVKPIDEKDFIKTVDKAIERIHHKKPVSPAHHVVHDKIGIPGNNAIDYINIDDILYLQAESSYTRVITSERTILSSYNLQKFREILDEQLFFQVHRSFIINLNHIRRYENIGILVMKDNTEIPVSKNNREDLLKLFNRVKNKQLKK